MAVRDFELVDEKYLKATHIYRLPQRATKNSAGYDFYSPCDITIAPGETSEVIWSGVKAKMCPWDVLLLFPRSSLGAKGLRLVNTIGVIDADYYGNPDNDGNIGVRFQNMSNEVIHIKPEERIFQGIFTQFYKTDSDLPLSVERAGGFGSTGRN